MNAEVHFFFLYTARRITLIVKWSRKCSVMKLYNPERGCVLQACLLTSGPAGFPGAQEVWWWLRGVITWGWAQLRCSRLCERVGLRYGAGSSLPWPRSLLCTFAVSLAAFSVFCFIKGQKNQKMLFLQLVFTVIQVSIGGHKVNGMSDLKSWQLDVLTFKNVNNGLDQCNTKWRMLVYWSIRSIN